MPSHPSSKRSIYIFGFSVSQYHILISNHFASAMEFRCLPLVFSLNLILMTAHAAIPPEVYWERMLPNTPMPKAIIDFLNLDQLPLWYGAKETQSTDQLYFYGAKKIQSTDEVPPIFYGAKKTQSRDQVPPLFYGAKKTQSIDQVPRLFYGAKKTQSTDQVPPIFYGAKKTQSRDQVPPLFYGAKKTQSIDQVPPLFYGAKKTQSTDQVPIFYGAKKTQSTDQVPIFYGAKKIQSTDQTPLFLYGAKKTQSEDQVPIFYGAKKTQSEDQPPLWYGVKKTYVAKRSLSQEDETILVANGHQHDIPKADRVFFEEGLRPGTKLDAHFKKRENVTPLLPRQIAQHIPLSSAKIKEIVEMLFVNPEPENVKILEETISMCEVPAITGEERYCATSLESMVDFVTSKLGKNARVISTEAEKESKSQKFSVKDGVKLLAEDKVIACHPMDYPYVVFMCHEISNTTAHFMPLEGEDGTRVKAAAVCHKDTSEWDPNHLFLQMLKTKPGAAPVCHIFPEGHLLWFAK
ncbi:BURP domain protein RD22 [Glycine soja]